MLKNTGWIIGIVIYTGCDTKIMRNASEARQKTSQIEIITNKIIVVIFFIQFICCLMVAVGSGTWNRQYSDAYGYFIEKRMSPLLEAFFSFWT